MQEIPVYLPQAVEEQQKIAECLSALDDVIEKQKATLAAWEELKKVCCSRCLCKNRIINEWVIYKVLYVTCFILQYSGVYY